MPISFSDIEAWDGDRFAVSFPAEEMSQRIRCAISWEALQDHFGGDNVTPVEAFRANRCAIERIAEGLITMSRFEQDGSILIRSQDC